MKRKIYSESSVSGETRHTKKQFPLLNGRKSTATRWWGDKKCSGHFNVSLHGVEVGGRLRGVGDKRENKVEKGGVNELAGRVTGAWLGGRRRTGSEEWQALVVVVVIISGGFWWMVVVVLVCNGDVKGAWIADSRKQIDQWCYFQVFPFYLLLWAALFTLLFPSSLSLHAFPFLTLSPSLPNFPFLPLYSSSTFCFAQPFYWMISLLTFPSCISFCLFSPPFPLSHLPFLTSPSFPCIVHFPLCTFHLSLLN